MPAFVVVHGIRQAGLPAPMDAPSATTSSQASISDDIVWSAAMPISSSCSRSSGSVSIDAVQLLRVVLVELRVEEQLPEAVPR